MRSDRIVVCSMVAAVVLAAAGYAQGIEPAKESAALPGNGDAGGLTPCLAVMVDGSPFWPTATFYAGDGQLTVAFQLGQGDSFKSLTGIWSVVDVGGGGQHTELPPPGKELRRDTITLDRARRGRLCYTMGSPLWTGKYHLAVLADGNLWKTASLTVIEDPKRGDMKQPSELLPLVRGRRWNFDTVVDFPADVRPLNGTIPGADIRTDVDRKLRFRTSFVVGPTEAAGTRIDLLRDDETASQVWVKLTVDGMRMTQSASGNKVTTYDPPELLVCRPGALPMAWTWQNKDGTEKHEFRMFGPLSTPNAGSDAAPIYLVVDESITGDQKATSIQVFMPGDGMGAMAKVVTDKDGRVLERTALEPAAPSSYLIESNDKLEERMGRLVIAFPKDLKADNARFAIASDREMKQSSGIGSGDKTLDLLPGKYWVQITAKAVQVEVRARHDTRVLTGGLRLDSGGDTPAEIYADRECRQLLLSIRGVQEVGLPIGTVYVKIGSRSEPVAIPAGETVVFRGPK